MKWALGAHALHDAELGSTDPAIGNCQLLGPVGPYLADPDTSLSTYPVIVGKVPTLSFSVECNNGQIGNAPAGRPSARSSLTVGISDIGDSRNWAVGEFALEAAGHLGLAYDLPLGGDSSMCCEHCATSALAVPVRVVVEEVIGGPTPYPAIVTANFKRVFRVEVDTPALASAPSPCAGPAEMHLSVRFIQTAGDFRYHAEQVCTPCE
ncbi:MAG: hypothetical protein ABIS92_02730 [Polyangia bacterium]